MSLEMNYEYIRKTFTHNGRRYTVRGKTETEAIRKMIERQMELERGDPLVNETTPVSKWYLTAFDTYKPNVSARCLRDMKRRFKNHALPYIGKMAVADVKPIQCQQILNSVSGCSRSMITKLAQELFFVFDIARKNKMISENPAADLVRPRGNAGKRRALTAEEREHLLKVLPKDKRFIFFELMLYCGCRPNEAAIATYEDVTEIDGIPFLHIRGTKTANSDRFVPIPEEIYPKLVSGTFSGLIAPNSAGNMHTESSYRRMVESLKREMNLSMGCLVYRNELIEPLPLAPDFVPYLLRHTYCTDLKKKGVDVRIAKNLMGHADIKTTANIYDHDDGETLILAAKQMGISRRV